MARLALLSATSDAIGEAGLEVTRVLDAIASSATQHIADSCSITLISDDGAFLDVVATHDRDPVAASLLRSLAASHARLRIDEGLVGEVCRTERPHFSPSVDRDRLLAIVSDAYRDFVERFTPASAVVVPLRARGKILGTISVTRREGRPFTDADADLVCEVGMRAGLAIENARLFQRAEEARARAEDALARAEAAVRARDNVLAIVSHDLRNPLSTVMMTAGRLARDEVEATKRRGETILRATVRMERLISDLLDFAQMDAGAFRVDARPYDVQTLLSHIAETFAATLSAKEQTLRVSGGSGRMLVDRERFVQLVGNIVANASKFSPPRTTISVDAGEGDDAIALRISDEGPGVPKEARGAIFERFVQVGAEPSRRLGVGLGLAIAKGIVDAHGGSISVDEAPTGGASFLVELPRVAPRERPTRSEIAAFYGLSVTEVDALMLRAESAAAWSAGPADGVEQMNVEPGGPFAGDTAFLVRIASGATYPSHWHDAEERLLMLAGGLRDDDGAELWAGDEVVNAAGTRHASTALEGGCLLAARLRSA